MAKEPFPEDLPKLVIIDYTNHRGERALRSIHPYDIEFKSTEWHPDPQWILHAYDYQKDAVRDFSLLSVHSWQERDRQVSIDASIAKQLQELMELNSRMKNRLQKLAQHLGIDDDVNEVSIAALKQILKDEEPT